MDSSEGSARLPGAQPAALVPVSPLSTPDPLFNLWVLRQRMVSLHDFLSQSIESKSQLNDDEVCFVSTEITSAIHDIFSNGAALVASSLQQPSLPPGSARNVEETVGFGLENVSTPVARRYPGEYPKPENQMLPATSMCNSRAGVTDPVSNQMLPATSMCNLRAGVTDPVSGDVHEIIELDAVELLAEHVHFCDICGKGFKRDANRRMHMRAHGEQFKTSEALAKPGKSCTSSSVIITKTLFSCPFPGCNRNRAHKKFRPLKSAICAKTHFKRSHCLKLYSCDRCNKKSFSVLADLKSHLKHCGNCRWKCSCGTSFLRKDKLFGHLALFQGHMPAVMEEEKSKELVAAEEFHTDIEEDAEDEDFIEGLLDSIDGSPIDDVLW